MVTLAWLVGLILVGTARAAHADGILVGPDLAGGAPKTLFESYDFTAYRLTVKPDDENSDWFGVSQGVLEIVGFLNNLILWICLGILYGGLTLLEWFLNLTIYRDSGAQIDEATRIMADQIFWPLIAATVAVGAFITYARWRGEGSGFLSDLGWVVAAAALGVGFAAGPSHLMDQVDSVRQDVATGVISGSAQFARTTDNPTGFPTPPITGDPQQAGTRTLVDGVWNTFGATTWCFAQFHDLDICKVAGAHALAGDDQWSRWMEVLDANGAVPEFREYGDWIRGQDVTRTGYLLLLALITVPMGLMLLRLVVAGLVAVVGFLLMLVVGLVFLAFFPIPGWFRQTGVRYWVFTLGMELQALFITVLISGNMVVSSIIATQSGTYGFMVVALLNLGLMMAAVKARAWLEMLTSAGGGGSMGFATALLARSAVRTVMAGAGAILGAGAGVAGALGRRASSRIGWRNVGVGLTHVSPNGLNMQRVSSLEPEGPIHATATRFRPGYEIAPPAPAALPGGPRLALPAGRTRGQTWQPSVPTARQWRGDRRLVGNVADTQRRTGENRRVWVAKPGRGISRLDGPRIEKRATRDERRLHRNVADNQRRHGQRTWTDDRGAGLFPIDPKPPRR